MKLSLKLIAGLTGLLLVTGTSAGEQHIKHAFLATDESRKQLLYVDEFNPANDWTQTIGNNRDIQIVSDTNFIISYPKGYKEFEIKTGKLLETVTAGKRIASAIRDARGHTFVAGPNGVWELDTQDALVKQIKIKAGKFFRLLRFSNSGTFLYSCGITHVCEADKSGKELKRIDLQPISPNAAKPYFFMQLASGNYLVSTGYGASLLELNPQGELIKSLGGHDLDKGGIFNFFGGIQQLDGGHTLVANWTGHKPEDSHKAPQVVELDAQGQVVWQWHDAERAGSIHGIAVLK